MPNELKVVEHVADQYTFVEKPNEEYMAIRLTDPKWCGLIYRYGKIRFGPENKTGQCPVKFDFDILENPGELENDMIESREFIDLLGNVLVNVIENSLIAKKEAEVAVVGPAIE